MANQKSLVLMAAIVLAAICQLAQATLYGDFDERDVEEAIDMLYGLRENSYADTEESLEVVRDGLSELNGLQHLLERDDWEEIYNDAVDFLDACTLDAWGEYRVPDDEVQEKLDSWIDREKYEKKSASIIKYLSDCKAKRQGKH